MQAKRFLWSIPILFISGSAFHYLYELSGEMPAVGLLAPVNESIFEHCKLFPLPALIWYVLSYLNGREELDPNQWFTAALLSIIINALSIGLTYYFFLGAFALEAVWLDIGIFFVSVAAAQAFGLHYCRHGKGLDWLIAGALIFLLLVAFAVATMSPPQLPIFRDPVTGGYGI